MRFVIARDGSVSWAGPGPTTTMPDRAVVDCVVDVVRSIRFPPPDGGTESVTYPLVFTPGD